MKLTIIAATGGVGRNLVDQALAAGHEVTAVARRPDRLPRQVRPVAVDFSPPDAATLETATLETATLETATLETATLRLAVAGADAVLSCLGATTTADSAAHFTQRATAAVVAAMRATGGGRLVVISAAPVSTTASPDRPHPPAADPGEGFVMSRLLTPVVKLFFGKVYTDLAAMEDELRRSGLDWTAMRPPRLVDRPVTGLYRTAIGRNLKGGTTISRADLAHGMLAALDRPETVGETVGIAY